MTRLATLLLIFTLVLPSPAVFSQDSSQTAQVISVREIRHRSSLTPSRYAGPIYFTVDVALRVSDQSYCVGYETPVLDEVHDLVAANGKDVRVEMKGKKLIVTLATGRRIKADLVQQAQC